MQPHGGVLQKTLFKNLRKIYSKIHLVEPLLHKVAGWSFATMLKKISDTDYFLEFDKIFKNTWFVEHLPTVASECERHISRNQFINYLFVLE